MVTPNWTVLITGTIQISSFVSRSGLTDSTDSTAQTFKARANDKMTL